MGKAAQIRARTDEETKRKAEDILEQLGLSPSAAINLFYRQIVLRGGLPFPVEVPNRDTRLAIEEARAGESVIRGGNLEALLTKLLERDPDP